jgi:hypothetical protein
MAQINQIPRVSIAGADGTYKNYTGADIPENTAVKLDPANNGGGAGGGAARGIIQTTSDVGCIGFTTQLIKAGGTGAVQRLGFGRAIAGAAIAVGDDVMSNASGQVVTATAGKEVIGKAEQAAAAATDQLAVYICRARNA